MEEGIMNEEVFLQGGNLKPNEGRYIVLRSNRDGSETRAYTIDSKRVADKLAEDFILLGFTCKVVDCDEEFARA